MPYRQVSVRYARFFNDVPYTTPAVLRIGLDKEDVDLDGIHPKSEKEFQIDVNGNFVDTNGVEAGLLTLWCNGGGITGSKYTVKSPDDDTLIDFTFVLHYGNGTPISLMQLYIDNYQASPPPGLRAITLDPLSPLAVFKQWFGSQAQYAALTVIDPNTAYFRY